MRELGQFTWLVLLFLLPSRAAVEFSKEKVDLYRSKVKDMFYHAYNGYLDHAYPLDELMPLTCKGTDTWGSFALTLVDSLDTLIILGNHSEFRRAAALVESKIDLEANVNVSVFETNIRVVGGLLSAHMLSGIANAQLEPGWPCQGPLLRLAQRTADKLLPAFNTPTGMPYGTVNLRYGVHLRETPITCTAGVGTYLLEFGALSRLTGSPHYERIALKALRELWKQRSPVDLVGNHINVVSGAWTATDAGIGAGVDSYFEYLAKGALLFQRPQLMEQFLAYRDAINTHIRQEDWFMWVGMAKGGVTMPVFQSLEAFWPGVLSLIGDTESAMRILSTYRQVMKQYGFTPEFFNIPNLEAVAKRSGYPLRPELIESTMYLYRATKDPQLLELGAEMVEAIEHSARTPCGYATVQNVKDHTLEDRMESFFLAETTKYLYLLFDTDNFIHNPGSKAQLIDTPDGKCVVNAGGYFFNTEAHPIDPSILYCCSQQRKKDLDIIHDFEANLSFVDMLGLSPGREVEAEEGDELDLEEKDYPPEVIELGGAFVPPHGVEARPDEISFQLQDGTNGTVSIDKKTSSDDNEYRENEEELEEEMEEDGGEDGYTGEDEAGNIQPGVAEAAHAPTLARPTGDAIRAANSKMSMDEMLAAQAGGDVKNLRLNFTKALKAAGKEGSADFAANLVDAFKKLLVNFDDLVEATGSLQNLESLNFCDNREEFCPVDSCRRLDAPSSSRALTRLLQLLYAAQRRPRRGLGAACALDAGPKEGDAFRASPPDLRFFGAPLVDGRATVRRLGEELGALAESAFALLSCPLPPFLARFSGLGQVVPER